MTAIQKHSQSEIVSLVEKAASSTDRWVFDCDGTLIHGDIASMTAWALIRFGLANAELLPPEYETFRNLPFAYSDFRRLRDIIIANKGINAIYEWETYLHAGLPPKTSHDMAKFAVAEGLKTKHIAFTKPLSELAKRHAELTWICSGSPDMCVWAVADSLGVDHKRVVGTRLETVDGVYANRIMPPGVVWEDLKRVALDERGVTEAHFVAGDTIGDWAMFDISTRFCWCIVWGKYRHRGEEFRGVIQERVLGLDGPELPHEPGYYTFPDRDGKRTWIFEILGPDSVEPTGTG